MSLNKPMIFSAPILITHLGADSGFIEGCNVNKAPVYGPDQAPPPPPDEGCDGGLGSSLASAIIGAGAAIGGTIVTIKFTPT